MTQLQGLDAFVERELPRYKDQLASLVAIPSISCESAHNDDCIRVVRKTGTIAEAFGFTYQLVETAGHPALVAHLEVNSSAPWVTVYNHLDVQPVTAKEWYITDPFSPHITDEKIVGRGTTDDKGPMLAILYAVHYLQQTKQLPVNVQLVYETEEEIGSDNFGTMLDATQASGLLKPADSVLISDTIFEGDNPAITYKLRGIAKAKMRIQLGSKGAAHSGFGGRLVVNPLHLMSEVIADCVYARTGAIKIPGIYTGLIQPRGGEDAQIRELVQHTTVEHMLTDLGWSMGTTTDSFTALYNVGHLPTFEVHNIHGGEAGTKVPAYAEAHISIRLGLGQDPATILEKVEKYVTQKHPYVQFISEGGFGASVTPIENPFMEKARAACLTGYGKEALIVAAGGSIGSVLQFQRVAPHAPVIMIAQSLITDGYHAPNEEFRWSQAIGGIKTIATYLSSLGDLKTFRI